MSCVGVAPESPESVFAAEFLERQITLKNPTEASSKILSPAVARSWRYGGEYSAGPDSASYSRHPLATGHSLIFIVIFSAAMVPEEINAN